MTAISNQKRGQLRPDNAETLLDLAAQGSAEAFRQLVIDQHQSVRVFLARYVHCEQHVDDLAQEVFVAAFKQLKQFRLDSSFSTWLLGIARNKALHFLRTELRRRGNQRQFFEAEGLRRSIAKLDLKNDTRRCEDRIAALQDCLELLPNKSRQLIERFYFEKETSAAIAKQSKQKDSSIRMQLKRIRGVLQKCISSKLAGADSNSR